MKRPDFIGRFSCWEDLTTIQQVVIAALGGDLVKDIALSEYTHYGDASNAEGHRREVLHIFPHGRRSGVVSVIPCHNDHTWFALYEYEEDCGYEGIYLQTPAYANTMDGLRKMLRGE